MFRLLTIAALLFSASSFAADLYVSTLGSDSNSGSASAPFRTIQKATNVASAGTTVHVAPGTYAESLEITRSGTASSPLRFVSDQKWQAKVTGSPSGGSTFMVRSDYVEVVNFDVSSVAGFQGIELYGSHDKALGNHVHHISAGACANGLGGAGIASSHSPPWSNPYSADSVGTGNVISGNLVHDIGDPTLGCALIHGIYVMNYQNTVTNNIIYKTMGWGITSWHYSRQNILSNNTVFNNNVGGINTGANDDGSVDDSTTVANNLVFYNGSPSNGFVTSSLSGPRYGFTQEGNFGPNNRFLNNIAFGNKPADYNSNVPQSGGRSIDPALGSIFVNWNADGSGDYHLRTGSGAADLGTTACAPNVNSCTPSVDYDGATRPQGSAIDVGAFELAVSSTPALADTTAPSTSISSPLNGATYYGGSTVQITASASDNLGVNKVEFYVNGNLKCTDTTANYTCSFKTTKRRGVYYRIQTKAYDAAGNFGSSSIVTIRTR